MWTIGSRALPLALAMALAACAPALLTSAREPVVVERLFFGRNIAGVQMVRIGEQIS